MLPSCVMAQRAAARDLMAELARALAPQPDVRLALLFGSQATGQASETSDVDLALDAPNADLQALAGALSADLGVEVDVVSLRQTTIPLLEALVRDSVVIYESSRGAAAAWRARALSELETDRPWFARMRDAWLRRVAEHGLERGK
jgi:uncharacterized protein